MAAYHNADAQLEEVRDALAGIAALLSGAQATEIDRTAVARLIELQVECAALTLERLAGPTSIVREPQ